MKIGTTKSGLNYRDGPNANATKLGTWDAGQKLLVMRYDETWYQVWHDGRIVFAHGDYIDLGLDINQAIADMAAVLLPSNKPTPTPSGGPDFTRRVLSIDGALLTPLYSNVLSSDTQMHLDRGSEPAFDITAHPQRTEMYPIKDGTVYRVERLEKPTDPGVGKYGENVLIDHGDIFCWYCHLEFGSIRKDLAKGVKLGQNEQFASVGATGLTSFPKHTHMTIFRAIGNYARIHPETLWRKGDFHWWPFAKSADLAGYNI